MTNRNEIGLAMTTSAKVALRFGGDALVPDEVTRVMGISPTFSYAKGEPSHRTKTPRWTGIWGLEFESDDVEPAAKQLLDAIATKRGAIDEIVAQMSAGVSVSIWWEPEGGQGGYTLSTETVVALASLGERIDFYFA